MIRTIVKEVRRMSKRKGRRKQKQLLKKRDLPKGDVVWRQSSEEATLAKKPHYNGFACGHGAHDDTKYNRTKSKRQLKQQLRQEGASRGSFLLCSINVSESWQKRKY